MKIAICYSGQLRNMRMMLNNHIEYLLIPLMENNTIDIYLHTDAYNTTRTKTLTRTSVKIKNTIKYKTKNEFIWTIEKLNVELVEYFKKTLEMFCNNLTIEINENCEYNSKIYNQNMAGQLSKFCNVLKMVQDTYDIVIRLRPDIYFECPINTPNTINLINLIDMKSNTLYQNNERIHNYAGDSIQIFNYKHLTSIIKYSQEQIHSLTTNTTDIITSYESIINSIFSQTGLQLEWINNFVCRWYDVYAVYFNKIQLKYFSDWINMEYKFNFSIEKLKQLIDIRKQHTNLLDYQDYAKLIPDTNKLYVAALDADINAPLYKDVVGLIPCSGSASRLNGIPKFLLPCKKDNLIHNTIDIFKKNNINNIYISISKENEHFIEPINKYDNDVKYIVKNTKTMSETVYNLVNIIHANKYILLMPDTYFVINNTNNTNTFFNELITLNKMLDNYDIVVVLWKIKESQYGKLGQINIENNKITSIVDKDITCRYPYSWGIIGWTNKINSLIDITTPHIGYILNQALLNNIDIGYIISSSEYYDCGTANEYFDMIKKM